MTDSDSCYLLSLLIISGYRQKLSAEKFNVGDFDTDTSSARNENSNQPVEPEPLQ